MPMYPGEVEVNEAQIARITSTYKQAYKEIVREISTATDFGVANRKVILAQVEATLTALGEDVDKFIAAEIPNYYKVGATEAVAQLSNVGAEMVVQGGYNLVHKQAIAALVDETSKAFLESLTGVNRSAQILLGRAVRQQITQQIAKGLIAGDTRREVKRSIVGTLQEQGLNALIDKGGHRWTLDRYSEMLFRTKAVEARNRGLVNRMAENGYDLVQVSSHRSDHEECAVWEGKILSINGATPGYNTVVTAEKSGLFHPNCKHAINALIPSLAKQTRAYNPNTKTLSPAGASLSEEFYK